MKPTLTFFYLLLGLIAGGTPVAVYASPQQAVRLSDNRVAENQAAGTEVGTFTPASATYTLTGDANDNAAFEIVDRQLLTAAPLDFEEKPQYTLAVSVSFRGQAGEDSLAINEFVIDVADANDPPVVVGQSPLSVEQNTPLPLALTDFTVEDQDADDTYPQGFLLQPVAGDNYTVSGQTITPAPGFVGSLPVSLTISDGEAASALYTATVQVNAPEEQVPTFSLDQDVYEVNEDFVEPQRVVAEPEDADQVVTYEIVPAEVDFATLTADNSNGIYIFSSLPDQNGEEDFVIRATNEQDNSFEQEFTLRVAPINDAPAFAGVADNNQRVAIEAEPVTIPNFATNIVAGPPTATDEIGQTTNFAVVASDQRLFAQPPVIDPAGTLTFQPTGDRAGASQINVVLVDDGRAQGANTNQSAPQNFTVEVLEPQVSQPVLTNSEVAENAPAGTVVGALSADGINPEFSIESSDPDPTAFRINGNRLLTNKVLNFEQAAEYTVRIETTAGIPLFRESESRLFTITVTNVEEPPTGVALSSTTVVEGAAAGSAVGVLSAVGGATEVPPTFVFASGPGGADNDQFTITGNQLTINAAPDAEVKSQYNIRLQAVADGVSPPQNFVVTVTNVAEPPTDITLSDNTLPENQPVGTVVGELTAVGGAATEITYALAGADAAAFAIDGNQLVTNSVFDFEVKSGYAITVTATGDGSFSKNFAINVTNVPEPPTDITLDNNSVDEGAPVGTVVGNLTATGGEGAADFELAEGEEDDGNRNFTIEGNVLSTTAVLNFEEQASYSIRVRAIGDGTFVRLLTVNVINQPDPPTDIALSAANVTENQPAGTVVGELSATGGDGPYTFSLVANQGNNSNFTIVENELRTAQAFDFEATPDRDVVVRVSNSDGSYEETFPITVVNAEEPPTDITLNPASVAENQPAGTPVGTLSATGGEGPVTYTFVSGPGSADNNQFSIEGNSLLTAAALNFEEQATYSVRIRATGDGFFGKALTITVTNVAEPPIEIQLSSAEVAENQPAGTVVGTLSTVGGVGGATYTLVGNNNNNSNFRIAGSNLVTNVRFDQEFRNTYQVRIRATSDGSLAENFTITVTNVDEPPVLSGIENTFLEFAEGDDPKIITPSIRVDDPDSEILTRAEVSFTNDTYVAGEDQLTIRNEGIAFEWSADQGVLTIRGPITSAQLQNALRAVRYVNLSDVNPTASTRRVSFQVFDALNGSNQQERFIRVSNSNIPPTLSDLTLSTGEDEPVALVQNDFAAAYGGDEDGSGFPGTIFVLTLPEQGSLVIGGRTLTDDDLGGQGFRVSFDEDLIYRPQADISGTDGFRWTARDNGGEPGIPADVTISIVPENDPPVLTAPAAISVEEDTDESLAGISVAEPDNDPLRVTLSVSSGSLTIDEAVRADVTLVTGTGENESEIVFEGTLSSVNGVLTSLIYTPSEEDGTLNILVSDVPANEDEPLTAEATVTLTVIPQNDNPVLTALTPDALFYTENSAPIPVADSIRVTDEENDNVVAAVVSIDSGASSADELLFENTETITASLANGVLTLTGAASPAAYQSALRGVTFRSTSDRPDATPRTLRFVVTDATGERSNELTRPLVVVPVEDTLRILELESEPLYFAIGGAPVLVSETVRPEDPDTDVIDRMVVSLGPDYVAADDSLGSNPIGPIASEWDATSGTLTLSGTASVAEYQQSLRSVTYYNRNPAAAEGSRLLTIQGFSGEIASPVATREIQLINNAPPTLTDFSVTVSGSAPYSFTTTLFQANYSDDDNRPSADGFAEIQVVALPQQGTLLLDETPLTPADVQAGLTIATADIPSLSYISNQGYLGEDAFTWNATDGAEFAETPARVIINVSDLRITLGEAIEKCLNRDSVSLEVVVTGGTAPYQYNWSANSEESIAKNSSIVAVLPTETTVYAVAVTDAEGVMLSDSVPVTVVECPEQELDIPTAFTPDGDNVNDEWEVGNIFSYESSVVEIYDRYGHRLFRSEDYSRQPWDGTYRGEVLPTGTYYYTISLNGGAAHYKGSVTILK